MQQCGNARTLQWTMQPLQRRCGNARTLQWAMQSVQRRLACSRWRQRATRTCEPPLLPRSWRRRLHDALRLVMVIMLRLVMQWRRRGRLPLLLRVHVMRVVMLVHLHLLVLLMDICCTISARTCGSQAV